MVNDPSHQCLGLALPGTSGPEGLTDARKAGHVQMLAPGATQGYDIEAGALCGETAVAQKEGEIAHVLAGAQTAFAAVTPGTGPFSTDSG